MKAKYVAACEITKEAVWLHKFPIDLEIIPDAAQPITFYCDNTRVVVNSKEPKNHKHSKYIERRYHLIREIVTRGDVDVK